MGQLQLSKRLKTRSYDNAIHRIYSISKRYGITRNRFIQYLYKFYEITNKYSVTPTFPVTAMVLARHSRIFRIFQDLGVKFAIHGYRHVDYSGFKLEDISRIIRKTVEIFQDKKIVAAGFRFPYLRWNKEFRDILEKEGLEWSSNETVCWKGLDNTSFMENDWKNFQKIMATYSSQEFNSVSLLPKIYGAIVELPVALPDDDILIDRLKIYKQEEIFNYWHKMFIDSHKENGYLNYQMHPERTLLFCDALESLLQEIKKESVWVVSLDAVSRWWKERSTTDVRVVPKTRDTTVTVSGSKRTNLFWGKDCLTCSDIDKGKGWKRTGASRWSITGKTIPLIAVPNKFQEGWRSFLTNLGYLYELNKNGKTYAYRFPEKIECTSENRIKLKQELAQYSLLRIGLWPEGYKSAVSISGDIDSINTWDFLERFCGKE